MADILAEHRQQTAELETSDRRRRHAADDPETSADEPAATSTPQGRPQPDEPVRVASGSSPAPSASAADDRSREYADRPQDSGVAILDRDEAPERTDGGVVPPAGPPEGPGFGGSGGDGGDDGDGAGGGSARRRTRGDAVRTGLRGIGQTLITLGVVVALFIVYEAFITDIFNAQKQDELKSQLQDDWQDPTLEGPAQQETTFSEVPIGDAFAVMRIPSFGADYAEAVVQGTTNAALEKGPGHYTDTVGPGEIGNFSIAGHRVGKGSPFLNLDKLAPGDAIVIETEVNWYIYRVIGDPATGSFDDPAYPAPGQEITEPADYAQVAAVPHDQSAEPTQALLTLTTCHPKFSAAERLIIHAYLDGDPLPKAQYPNPEDVPALTEG
ncbi:hypothetical protein GCM10027298_38080 [Epidermidibacterium keratini]